MRFKKFEKVKYKHNILFEVIFQARCPEIMRISQEDPVKFQDTIRKEGYPEFAVDIPLIPSDIPKEVEKIVSTAKVFHFFSEDRDWKVSLAKDFIALTCNRDYRNYSDFRKRLQNVLQTFHEMYEPSYFTRVGLRYRNIANGTFLPDMKESVESFIPEYIFPELALPIAENIETLQKVSQYNDGEIKANVVHVLSKVSGKFGQKQLTNEKSYIIDVDSFFENRLEKIDDLLTKCSTFKQYAWDVFQWSITDKLRESMGESKS